MEAWRRYIGWVDTSTGSLCVLTVRLPYYTGEAAVPCKDHRSLLIYLDALGRKAGLTMTSFNIRRSVSYPNPMPRESVFDEEQAGTEDKTHPPLLEPDRSRGPPASSLACAGTVQLFKPIGQRFCIEGPSRSSKVRKWRSHCSSPDAPEGRSVHLWPVSKN